VEGGGGREGMFEAVAGGVVLRLGGLV
jgi:hypothetical protein